MTNEFLALCIHCGCPVSRDGPYEFSGVFCNHEIPDGKEEVLSEGINEE